MTADFVNLLNFLCIQGRDITDNTLCITMKLYIHSAHNEVDYVFVWNN